MTKESGSDKAGGSLPRELYRRGSPNPINNKLEPDEQALSFFDSLENLEKARAARKAGPRDRPDDREWVKDNQKTFTDAKVRTVREALEETALIVEHRQYFGGSSPERLILYRFDDFANYVRENVCAGDKLRIWSFKLLTLENTLVAGTVPDEQGSIPVTGSY